MSRFARPHLLIAASIFTLWLSGCTTRVYGSAYADTPDVYYDEPTLVAISPDVWVVSDYHTTVYHHGGFYWHYDAGLWYQSTHWGGPRIRVHAHVVPGPIVHRDHRSYVRYRGHYNAPRRRGPAHVATRTRATQAHGGAYYGSQHRAPATRATPHRAPPQRATPHRVPPRATPAAHRRPAPAARPRMTPQRRPPVTRQAPPQRAPRATAPRVSRPNGPARAPGRSQDRDRDRGRRDRR